MYKLTNIKYATGGFNLTIDNLHLKKGNIYAVSGSNGSGKTTFLHLLGFLLKPVGGEIIFKQNNVNYSSERHLIGLRRIVGYNLQHPYLLNTTVYKNIAYGLKIRRFSPQAVKEKTKRIISAFSIEDIAYKNIWELSGGEAQKTALARILVLDTEVVLLDEPCVGLDKKSADALEKLLLSLNAKEYKTIIFATHLESRAYGLTKNILSVNGGKVTPVSCENVFSGNLTGSEDAIRELKLNDAISIKISTKKTGSVTAAIDPKDILLSAARIKSSALNSFEGRITKAEKSAGNMRVFVNAGGKVFCVAVTEKSFHRMSLNIAKPVWITFKANAVRIL